MFFREKISGGNRYLQLVENTRMDGKPRQRVLASLGRIDHLEESGQLEAIIRSAARFSKKMIVLTAHDQGETTTASTRCIGPSLIFERLWKETGCQDQIEALLDGRKFGFNVERAVFMTVLHRLTRPGSDRQCDRWQKELGIQGSEDIRLHHLYRAMAWLGEALSENEQDGATLFSPRCTKDRIEEGLFARRRDLFTSLELVFFDTTSIYIEGEGGETMGERGFNKDHRPDLKQMVVGAVLDNEGRPVCCELWPGSTADVKSLVPVVDRLQKRFAISRVCIVADRGMISQETILQLESDERQCEYILGARLRLVKEIKQDVLSRAGRYQVVNPPRTNKKDPSPLKVKEVMIEDRRYIVCHNEEQARKDRADREAIVAGLEEKLKRGEKSLVGNKGYRKYLKSRGKQGFEIDREKVEQEARFDGKWVLRTSLGDLPAEQVALKYKQLLTVESLFRSTKSLLETRPIYHKCDETIRGHVFCSFLALTLMKELEDRLATKGHRLEWKDVIRDLSRLEEVEIEQDKKRFVLRTQCIGVCGKVFQAVGVALPPTLRQIETEGTSE
ncbi:MAG: IS1634 family transposase [Proteobacteria bacterium]|nr:IS1634 family transposase [Pseudomonadota bacterium]